jgi:4-carboxymuconolactone decarboxylase
MTEEEMIERGKRLFERCFAGVIPLPEVEPGAYTGMSMKMFHDFWGDARLSFREKRLIVIGVLAGMGADPGMFETHARAALRNSELSADELRAVVLMALPYVGYPHASPYHGVAERLIAELEQS